MFTVLSPLFLIGLASAAIPLLIHLSRSKRTKKLRFSTTRFFTDQFLRSYRMSQLKELLLLALRMALCALLATALARPLFVQSGRAVGAGQSRAVVLIVDNSASMTFDQEGESLLDRALTSARGLLDELQSGDVASVVLGAKRAVGPEVLFPELTPALNDVRQAVDGIAPSGQGTDLIAAIKQAEELLRGHPAQSKEIYVLSDLQASAFDAREDAPAPDEETTANQYFFVQIRPTSGDNRAVTAIRYAAARPMAGAPFSIEPHIRNHSASPRAATVRLVVDGRAVAERRLEEIQAQRWAAPRFHHAFDSPGWHSGHVEVLDEGMTVDDRRYFAFEVLDNIRVLAVNGAPSAAPRLDELFFLRKALSVAVAGNNPVRLDMIEPPALAQADLAGYPLVILANVETLSVPVVERLEAFVDAGGSLLVFLGEKVSAEVYNERLAGANRLHEGLLPATLAGIEGDPAGEVPIAFISQVDGGHPALAAFAQSELGNLNEVQFQALWRLTPKSATVVMRAGGQAPGAAGFPLMCEKSFGKGRVMLCAAPCDRDWSNLPLRPVFLPWIYRTVAYLAQAPLARQGFFATGDRIPLAVSAGEGLRPLSVRRPDGTTAQPVQIDDPDAPLAFDDTRQPGVYALLDPTDRAAPPDLFVANLESYESELTYLDDLAGDTPTDGATAERPATVQDQLRAIFPGRPQLAYVARPDDLAQAAFESRRGFPLWTGLLWIVLAIALLEPWLANWISQKHYARPQEISLAWTGRAKEHVPRGAGANA